MIDALLTSPLLLAIGSGIVVTALLGLLCEPFLKVSVIAKLPEEFEARESLQKEGGGADLGVLERLLFFAAAWLNAHVIAGAWLAFKVAAKWAAWQHIIKLPETLKGENEKRYMDARSQLSSNMLGRFLNGTLYNIFCAGMGWVCARIAFANIDCFPGDLRYWLGGVFIVKWHLVWRASYYFSPRRPRTNKKVEAWVEKLMES